MMMAAAVIACSTAMGKPARVVEKKPDVTKIEHADKVKGYNGNVFYILRPVAKKLKTVEASEFGLSTQSSDNTEALRKAFNYCKENPGTKLVIGEGKYRFSQNSTIYMDGLQDVVIDGTGADFVTDKIGYFLGIKGCNCLEITGLSVDWDRDNDPIDEVFKVRNADPENHTFEMEFFQKENVDPAMHMEAITQCDPESFTFGAKSSSKEWYRYQNTGEIRSVEAICGNVLKITHSGGLDKFSDGDMFILRHHVYDGTVFSLTGASKNITFSSLNIFGSPGMAIIAEGRSSHFQVLDTFIGVAPEYSDLHHVSLGADAFHFVNADGRFLIEGCDISRQGDDAINVHDGLGYVRAVKGNKAWMHASGMIIEKGDVLGFKDRGFAVTDFTATVQDVKYVAVSNSNASAGTSILAIDSQDRGGNSYWSFTSPIHPDDPIRWTGAVSTDWADGANWDLKRAPVLTDKVYVDAVGEGGNYPVMANGTFVQNKIYVGEGATLPLSASALTVSNEFEMAGSLVFTGTETLHLVGNADFTGGAVTAAGSFVLDEGETVRFRVRAIGHFRDEGATLLRETKIGALEKWHVAYDGVPPPAKPGEWFKFAGGTYFDVPPEAMAFKPGTRMRVTLEAGVRVPSDMAASFNLRTKDTGTYAYGYFYTPVGGADGEMRRYTRLFTRPWNEKEQYRLFLNSSNWSYMRGEVLFGRFRLEWR